MKIIKNISVEDIISLISDKKYDKINRCYRANINGSNLVRYINTNILKGDPFDYYFMKFNLLKLPQIDLRKIYIDLLKLEFTYNNL